VFPLRDFGRRHGLLESRDRNFSFCFESFSLFGEQQVSFFESHDLTGSGLRLGDLLPSSFFGELEVLDAVRQQPTLARFFYGHKRFSLPPPLLLTSYPYYVSRYIAGLCAETTIYPIDTVRRRQQAHGDATPLARRNVLQALQLLAKHEGHAGMFKGLSINLIKNPIGTAVSFVVNDHMKDVLGRMER